MFYAHFVLSKKGPLARIWLAAHWDKKLTKAHVFETNIDQSVDAIMKPKVKLALRTTGHLLLGVVRIYSRKAKYLLADCNEAFVKIKMAFRPGVVDLPEENREAAVAAITLQENFHDFDQTLADLNDIDMQAQFSVNQSRPEDITLREDIGPITFVGDDGFGDVGFDDREILRDAHLEDSLYKNPDMSSHQADEHDKTLNETAATDQPMDVDLEPPRDDFGAAVGEGFMDADDDDDDDDNSFGGVVDNDFFTGDQFIEPGGLFEDAPIGDVSMAPPVEAEGTSGSKEEPPKVPENSKEGEAEPAQPVLAAAGASGEQTTLISNEEEAFALEPLEATATTGTERKTKRKRKLIVDEQKGIPSETMKLQLSDTNEIVTTLDLAPPTKKLMHWKETGGVEKLFALPGRPIISKMGAKLFNRNLVTKPVKEDDIDEDRIELESPELTRHEETTQLEKSRRDEISTILEEPSTLEVSTRSRRSERNSVMKPPEPVAQIEKSVNDQSHAQDLFANTFQEVPVEMPPIDMLPEPASVQPPLDFDDGPPSIAPFSVPPPSVGPPSVPPPSVPPQSVAPVFQEEQEVEGELMPSTAEEEEKRSSKRTAQMQNQLDIAFRYCDTLSFKDMSRNLNRKQASSRFYTLLVLKKHQAVDVQQQEAFGDIYITKGQQFGIAC